MKKLKKLSLKKEEIINLNDFEMNVVRGGTFDSGVGEATAIVTAVTAVVEAGIAVYDEGEKQSWWNCPPVPDSQQADCMSDVSKYFDWYTGVQACMIPEVVVYGI